MQSDVAEADHRSSTDSLLCHSLTCKPVYANVSAWHRFPTPLTLLYLDLRVQNAVITMMIPCGGQVMQASRLNNPPLLVMIRSFSCNRHLDHHQLSLHISELPAVQIPCK